MFAYKSLNVTPSGLYSPKNCTVRVYVSGKLYCQNIYLNKVAPTGVISPKSCTVRNGSQKVLPLGWWFKEDATTWFIPLRRYTVSIYFPIKLHSQQFQFCPLHTCTVRFCFLKKLHRQSVFAWKVAPSGFFLQIEYCTVRISFFTKLHRQESKPVQFSSLLVPQKKHSCRCIFFGKKTWQHVFVEK